MTVQLTATLTCTSGVARDISAQADCSDANQQLLASLVPLSARYGKGVQVNGEPWVVMLESPRAVVASDPAHSTATRSVQLNLWRGTESAVGVLVVVELDTSHEPTCISSLELSGTFTPPSSLTPP